MDALSVNPIRPVALGALDAVRPPQALPVPAADSSQPARATPLSLQDLAQTLFQRSLQAATLFPVAPTATGTASLVQEATASLLASLSAQGSAAPAQVAAATPSTAPPSAPPAPTVQELPAPQDALATSLSPEFAMQTALRFGAGVQAQAALAVPVGELGAGLVRDATQVLRTGPLQPQGGGPGPEAFTRAQATLQRVLRSYEAAAVPARGNAALDLLA
ncbi:MAG: hypothetical protein IPP58_00355 [Holophagaceae bacterium]|uniref:Uncharacterized protein n=1 Tax=Candidatus Geothrix skivensis TaxID=2954439 RepID=A0A9D7SDL6_9BACT|nr:hypothetical protein [Candidatus Geothrix skivensis]